MVGVENAWGGLYRGFQVPLWKNRIETMSHMPAHLLCGSGLLEARGEAVGSMVLGSSREGLCRKEMWQQGLAKIERWQGRSRLELKHGLRNLLLGSEDTGLGFAEMG